MALSQSINLSSFGLTVDEAYGKITDVLLVLGQPIKINLDWFASSDAVDLGCTPIRRDKVMIGLEDLVSDNSDFVQSLADSIEVIHSPMDALVTALYILIKQQTAYSTAVSV